MANFGIDKQGLKKLDLGSLPLPAFKIIDVDAHREARAASDFMDQLDERARSAHDQAQRDVEAGLMLEDRLQLKVESISPTFGAIETPRQRQLKQAKALIGEQQFTEAIDVLEQLLGESPGFPEATYLSAFCHFRLGAFETALRILLATENAVQSDLTRMRRLRAQIRPDMYPDVSAEISEALREEQLDRAVERTRELVRLDPEAWLYRYLLCGSLLRAEQIEAAWQEAAGAADMGSDDERDQMSALRSEILEQLCRERMAPARQLFKAGKLRETEQLLADLDESCQGTVLYGSFLEYTRHRASGESSTAPGRSVAEAEQLYEYLISAEIDLAAAELEEERFEAAENVLEAAMRHVPAYAHGNFLLANSTYRRLMAQVDSEEPPAIEEVLEALERSLERAKVGAADPAGDKAAELLVSLEQTLEEYRSLQKEIERVNGVIEELLSICLSVADRLASEQQADELIDRFQKLRRRTQRLRKKLTHEELREVLEAVRALVDSMITQTKALKPMIRDDERMNRFYDY